MQWQVMMATISHLVWSFAATLRTTIIHQKSTQNRRPYARVQHVKNDDVTVPRVLHMETDLLETKTEVIGKANFQQALDVIFLLWSTRVQDAHIPEHLKDIVFVCWMSCEESIEKLYYAAKS